MIRHRDWETRLHDAIEARRHAPFAWGTQDCCCFAADMVHALTGADPLAAFRSAYSTEAEALAILEAHGGLEAMAEAAAAASGMAEHRPNFALRGDVALLDLDGRATLGIVLGVRVAAPAAGGLAFVLRERIARVWAV